VGRIDDEPSALRARKAVPRDVPRRGSKNVLGASETPSVTESYAAVASADWVTAGLHKAQRLQSNGGVKARRR